MQDEDEDEDGDGGEGEGEDEDEGEGEDEDEGCGRSCYPCADVGHLQPRWWLRSVPQGTPAGGSAAVHPASSARVCLRKASSQP